MKLPRGIRRLFRLGSFRDEVVRDVDEELDFHFERAVEALRRVGFTRAEAEREARRRFGNERAYREALERIDTGRVRVRERNELFDVVARTLSHALRGVGRAPGFALGVVTILALGIGANAVMFGVVDRLLLSPPQHVSDWERLRHIYVQRAGFNGEIGVNRTFTFPDYQDLRRVSGWTSVAAYTEVQELTLGRGAEAQRVRAGRATAELFPLLGVVPFQGRFYSADEDAPGAPPTAVLAHEFWERRFGLDEGVLGQTLEIGDGSYTVVGIAPPGFTGAELQPVDLWLPLQTSYAIEQGHAEWAEHRNWWFVTAVARLDVGATDAATTAQATAIHRSGRAEFIEQGRYDANAEVLTGPIIAARGPNPSAEADVARWLAGVSLIVLLIACLNVANLLLARGIRSRREIAVRLVLGVSRARLFGQALMESLVLSALGALAALAAAHLGGGVLHQLLLPNVAFRDSAVDVRLMTFIAVATLLTALLAGIMPAIEATRRDVADSLRDGGQRVAGAGSRARAGLLVGQAVFSVLLLVGAGLFVRSLQSAQALDLGYDAKRVVVISLEWNETLPGTERRAVYEQLLDRVRARPEVIGAGFTYTVPFQGSISMGQPRVPGLDSVPRHANGGPYINKVSSGFFEAMHLEILRGRGFQAADDVEGAVPVTVLTESMARAFWPNGDPLGQCLLLGSAREEGEPCTEVVGVVENHRREALVEDDEFIYYVNQSHPEFSGPPQRIVAGSAGPASALVADMAEEARAASGLVRFAEVASMQDAIDPSLRSWRLGATMFALFGALALIVAGLGLYSVLAFDVAVRRHELGVRAALGASVDRLVRIVLGRAVGVVTVGVVLGLVVSYAAARFVEPLLFGVSARDPFVYGGVGIVLLTVAVIAGTVPALRATRVDPTEALRAE